MSTKPKKTNPPSANPGSPGEAPGEPQEGFLGTPFERAVLDRLDVIAGLLMALPGKTQVVQQKGLDLSRFKFKVD